MAARVRDMVKFVPAMRSYWNCPGVIVDLKGRDLANLPREMTTMMVFGGESLKFVGSTSCTGHI